MVEFSELPTSWKIILEKMTGNVVMSEVDAPANVVLNKAEKHVPNGELVGTTDYNAVDEVAHKSRSLSPNSSILNNQDV